MTTLRIPNHLKAMIGVAMTGALLASAPCQAQLGTKVDDADTADGAVMHQTQGGLIDYRESTDAYGIVVRQYVDGAGTVYAVTWHGPAMPNVQSLLGTYFGRFSSGANANVGMAGLHAARVADGDLFVENDVRLRQFSGRAWLASELPPGVSSSDLQ